MNALEEQKKIVVPLARTKQSGFIAENLSGLGPEAEIVFHGALGLVTEAGEFLDVFKKALAYGQEIDRINLIEEIGDLLFYLQLCCHGLGITMQQAAQANVEKLKKRYPEATWSFHRAVNRDLAAERAALKRQTTKEDSDE